MDAYDNRHQRLPKEDLRNEYTFPVLLEIQELNPATTICDNGEKNGEFTIYKLSDGNKTRFV